jgi:hypothetical protein
MYSKTKTIEAKISATNEKFKKYPILCRAYVYNCPGRLLFCGGASRGRRRAHKIDLKGGIDGA